MNKDNSGRGGTTPSGVASDAVPSFEWPGMRPPKSNRPVRWNWTHRLFSQSQRTATTLLELMLALSLLSVLMLLGWSLLNTFQDAEKRSWKLTQRVRVLRLTRAWLSNDMDHLVRTSAQAGADGTASIAMRFEGDSTGFQATIQPSLDPVQFFEKWTSNGSYPDVSTMDALLATEEERRVMEWHQSMWPAESIDVEYRFEATDGDAPSVDATWLASGSDDAQFELVRREWLPPIPESTPPGMNNRQSPNPTVTDPSAASERTLTIGDLYRVEDDASTDAAPALRETKLYGMTRPQVKYFDGQAWRDQWSSDGERGLPHAVALCFDFPSPNVFKRPEPHRSGISGRDSDVPSDLDALGNAPVVDKLASAESGRLGQTESNRLVDSTDRRYIIAIETGERHAFAGGVPTQPMVTPTAGMGTSLSPPPGPSGRRTSNGTSLPQRGER